jgi:ubiquinone/menaquinone biosynthesis C-methylase UbiE
MEWLSFGPYLARCRRAFLGEMKQARHAVVFGDGDGRFTQALLQANPAVHLDAVDSSAAMLRALQRRAGADANRVHTFTADAREWRPDAQPYDLVATHFFLDCLTTGEVQDLAARIRTALNPDAAWVVSEFAVPPGIYGRWVARPLVAFLYFAFRVMTGLRVHRLPDHHAALQHAGFTLRARRTWLAGLLAAEIWIPGRTPRRFTP